MNKLQELFNLGIDFGYKSKINKLNGQESWGFLKDRLDTTNICNWEITKRIIGAKSSSDIEEIYSYIHDDLKLYGENGDKLKYKIENHEDWERAHYVLQTIRIPRTSCCSIQKILQIGLNIGQYMASNEENKYNDVVNDYVRSNHLNQISSYVNLDRCKIPDALLVQSIELMREQIGKLPSKQDGGALDLWHSKYLKYKAKYLGLKNSSK
jgi:hypothetical protein